jgi:hypothetical protein
MRINLILLLGLFVLLTTSWVLFEGTLLVIALILILGFVVFSALYHDKMILFYLGAREIRMPENPAFFKVASQEAYKLSLPMPSLYFYNGTLERGFILHNRHSLSLVINKELLDNCKPFELSAICFELLLQAKVGLAAKRTRLTFLLGTLSWIGHSIGAIFQKIIPIREFQFCLNWLVNYLLNPWISFIFNLTVGQGYFKKVEAALNAYPQEKELFLKVGLKIHRADVVYSLPSKKLIELSSIKRSQTFQNIISLEFLPHEWDYLFKVTEV